MPTETARGPLVQIETTCGRPIRVDGQEIMPLARSVRVRLPVLHGGFMWNRPVAIVVRAADGSEYELPVHDVTRRMQVLVLAAGILGSLLIWLALRRR